MSILPSPPPPPQPWWTEVPSETVPQQLTVFGELTFENPSSQFLSHSLPPPSQTPSLHLTWPRPPLPSSQVASPENFWWLCAALGVRHLLTARPAPAYCHRPNYLPSSAAAAFHQMCNPLYTTVSKQEGGGKPPSGKARSTWTLPCHPYSLSILLLLQPICLFGQIHFPTWTITFCKLDILQRQIYLPPSLCTLNCCSLLQPMYLGVAPLLPWNLGFFLPISQHSSICLLLPTSFLESAPIFGLGIPIFWAPLPGPPNLWEGGLPRTTS